MKWALFPVLEQQASILRIVRELVGEENVFDQSVSGGSGFIVIETQLIPEELRDQIIDWMSRDYLVSWLNLRVGSLNLKETIAPLQELLFMDWE